MLTEQRAGTTRVGDFESCTGFAGIVNEPQPGCPIVVTIRRDEMREVLWSAISR